MNNEPVARGELRSQNCVNFLPTPFCTRYVEFVLWL